MLVIQHRYNDANLMDLRSPYVEIDVHISDRGNVVVKHDPDQEAPVNASYMVLQEDVKRFFVDIKQNLSVDNLKKITDLFGKKLLGIFDVPFPSAYFARKAGLPVYGRISEFEPAQYLFDRFWLDPLTSWTPKRYLDLLAQTAPNHKVVIAGPSLHGHPLDVKVARAILSSPYADRIQGFVTKMVPQVEDEVAKWLSSFM